MRWPLVLLAVSFVVQASAQITNPLTIVPSSVLSEVLSRFSSLTSSLGNIATTTSDASTTAESTATSDVETTSSDASSSTEPSSTTSTELSSTTALTALSSPAVTSSSPSSQTPSSASGPSSTDSASSASTSGTVAPASASTGGGNSHDRTLAIALGTILGALALGLFILLLLILCRRRRRRRAGKVRHGSLSSVSDDALAAQIPHPAHKTPMTTVLGSRNSRSLNRRSAAGVPLMSERSHYDVPSAHEFGDDSTAPFVPGTGDPRRSSGILPNQSTGNMAGGGIFRDGTGLNNHPYSDNHHHAGTVLPAAAAGAALGGAAAAARHSRSSERRHTPAVSGDLGVHPAYWDEPPPRSSHRNSSESMGRRSGSMPRGRFYGPQDHAGSPLRNNVGGAAAGAMAGAATGAAVGHAAHRSRERGRSLPKNPPPYAGQADGMASVPLPGSTGEISGSSRSTPYEMSAAQTPPVARGNVNPLDHPTMASAAGTTALGAGAISHGHSRSRSRSHPPLPPALQIPNPTQTRHAPSRSPRRARFSDGHTYHDPMPMSHNEAAFDGPISPPTTVKSNSFYSNNNRFSTNTAATDELVSPISPDDALRGIGHSMSLAPGRANLVEVPRSREISPEPAMRQPDTVVPMSTLPPATGTYPTATRRTSRPANSQRPHSGLVSAIQNHFTESGPHSKPPPYKRSQTPENTYQAYSAIPTSAHRPSPFSDTDVDINNNNNNANMNSLIPNNVSDRTRPSRKPIARKPVPYSQYNSAEPAATPFRSATHPPVSTTATTQPTNENWWRNEEDHAWTTTYGNGNPHMIPTNVGQAR